MSNPTKTQIGYVISTATSMKVSDMKWDLIFHKDINCPLAKRPQGCLVCSHDVEKCTIENCPLCKRKKVLLNNTETV
jgi:hypothetical protein